MALPRTPLGSLQRSPDSTAGRGGSLTPAFGFEFRPFVSVHPPPFTFIFTFTVDEFGLTPLTVGRSRSSMLVLPESSARTHGHDFTIIFAGR